MGRPWFPMYAADLWSDSDVAMLTDAQFRMLILVWCRCCLDGGVPSDPDSFAKLMKCRRNVAQLTLQWLPNFLSNDPLIEGRLISLRMEKEAEKYNAIVERNRVNGAKGGRPPKPSGLILGNPEITEPQPQPQEDKTPIPPKGGRRGRKGGFSLDYPQEVLELAGRLKAKWPTQSVDGSPVRIDPAKFVGNLASIIASNPKVPLGMLEAGAEMYLGQEKPPKRWKAPQFYFGPGEDPPISIVYARAAYTKQKQENPNAQAS